MKYTNKHVNILIVIYCLVIGVFFSNAVSADMPPDFSVLPAYQTPIADATTERADYNLGATGMRGWSYGWHSESNTSREILVRVVEKGSPADGIFKKFDLITGVDGKHFTGDARDSLAAALEVAEKTGKLNLICWRDGREKNVTLKIRVLGEYSDTAPFDCPKTDKIIENSCNYITVKLLPEMSVGLDVPTSLNMLLLLSTDDPKYLPQVRRYAKSLAATVEKIETWDQAMGHWTWYYGYRGMALTEYYLRTGDETVLPAIEKICTILSRGQGFPGAWSHSLAKEGHLFPGYGAVNSTGMVCLISMALADKCGVKVNQKALADAFAFFGSFAGKGGPPYGDHAPFPSNSGNGKSGGFAVAMTVLDAPTSAAWFSKLTASANHYNLYEGHTGNFWNHTWTPLGANLAGRDSFINFFKAVRINYTLMRRWDGGYVTNPDYSKLECYSARRKYGGPEWGPGAFTLFMAAPKKKLQIFGTGQSVFAKGAWSGSGNWKLAMTRYRSHDYQGCIDILTTIDRKADMHMGMQETLDQLMMAAKNAMAANTIGLEKAAKNISKGDCYLASVQLNALKGVVDPEDKTYKNLLAKLDNEKSTSLVKTGEKYYKLAFTYAEDFIRFTDEYNVFPKVCISPNHRRAVENIANNKNAGIYQKMAQKHLKDNPLHSYQRWVHEWLPQSEYSPLTPIFMSGIASEKNIPNVDINTLAFSKTPGERLAPINKKVMVEYKLLEPGKANTSQWQPGNLPLGEPDTGSKSSVRKLPAGMTLLSSITFNIDNQKIFSHWFVTCKAAGMMDISLNGKRIVKLDGIDKRGRIVHLKPTSASLFRPGENVLTVKVIPSSPNQPPYLDIGLDALKR